MYFKRLELIGFKSFAEKTTLNFEPGVTAVVGPNGCGKSNVADAIRWALGEQSTKSLRASNMQDVIFSGTDTIEPISFAEVSLTLSNEKRVLPIDYDEVTITRRIFRSGENEYLLNKTPVRLKDIAELLMGTGIGTESYAIIEQGKMDLVLSSKPEDRRYVFEEASGITKYKTKKREALRKLEETEQNLVRINDIIQEVKRQISSIERQARKAEKYKVEMEKLKDHEMKVSSYEYRNLKSDEKTACAERGDLETREKEGAEAVGEMTQRISGFRVELESVAQKTMELRNRNMEIINTVDKNTHKIDINKERIAETGEAAAALEAEIGALESKAAEQREAVERLKAQVERLVNDRAAKEDETLKKESRGAELLRLVAETTKRMNGSKLETMELVTKETHAKNELIKIGAESANRSSRERRIISEKEAVSQELAREEERLEKVSSEASDLSGRAGTLKEALQKARQDLEENTVLVKTIEEEAALARNDEAATTSKIEFLEDLIERHEGFGAGVKSLLDVVQADPGRLSGVRGVIADLLRVKAGYEIAVSVVLGEDAETIVVDTLQDAVRAVNYLKDNKFGRANFVALSEIRKLGTAEALSAEGLPLESCVTVADEYKGLVNYFFGDTSVIGSVDEIERVDSLRRRFVTTTGVSVYAGRLSGGSVGDREESLLIGRRERLQALKDSREAALRRIAEREAEKALKIEAGSLLESAVRRADEAARQEEINLANLISKKGAQEEFVNKLREEISVLDLEIDEVREILVTLKEKESAFVRELGSIAEAQARLVREAEESQRVITASDEERDRLGLEVATLRAELASQGREVAALEGSLQKEGSALVELSEAAVAKTGSLLEMRRKCEEFGQEIVALEAENITLEKDIALFREENAKLDQERSDLTDKLGILELQMREQEKNLEMQRNEIRDVGLRIMDLGYKRTHLKERIASAYKEDLDEVHIEVEEKTDWEEHRVLIQELRQKLDDMGPVNLIAIDEHKELEERYNFLTRQEADLANAKDSLHKAIQKINRTTREIFLEVFQKIQVEFKNFFRLLFGGGQAELLLIDEQDVLESGIEIVARPPGKKLQNIMLLSGGEKALTAIALLFAIFKVRPSPFCLLDEIDAPLDESNVGRFSNVLKDFLKMSQFIIITHNKRTIELADVMYGITMQERGVSKIVSVKFLADAKARPEDGDVEVVAQDGALDAAVATVASSGDKTAHAQAVEEDAMPLLDSDTAS